MKKTISGTYSTNDVEFLLTPINIPSTTVFDKEKLIQNQSSHYSEMITYETIPSANYIETFYDALMNNDIQFAQDVVNMAYQIAKDYQHEDTITIVSLARAGTPIGVLLKNFLATISTKKIHHYCVSIIRDIGLDFNAIDYILTQVKDTNIVFVDGWTGKGVITRQLKESIDIYNNKNKTDISSHLYVVLDISGTAHYAASYNDYLIPSAIFNATISGLISRTIYNPKYLKETDFHGYIFYEHLKEYDISNWFITSILSIMFNLEPFSVQYNKELINMSKKTIQYFQDSLHLKDINFIKPGIAEATRVMLRRVPDKLFVKSKEDEGVQHLLLLAQEKNVIVIEKEDLLYNAVAIIKELD